MGKEIWFFFLFFFVSFLLFTEFIALVLDLFQNAFKLHNCEQWLLISFHYFKHFWIPFQINSINLPLSVKFNNFTPTIMLQRSFNLLKMCVLWHQNLTRWDFIGLAAHPVISGHSNLHANAYPWQADSTSEGFHLYRVKRDTSIIFLLCVRWKYERVPLSQSTPGLHIAKWNAL